MKMFKVLYGFLLCTYIELMNKILLLKLIRMINYQK